MNHSGPLPPNPRHQAKWRFMHLSIFSKTMVSGERHASGWPCNNLRNPHNLTISKCSVATHDFSQPGVPLFIRAARSSASKDFPMTSSNLRFVAAERLQHFQKLALSYKEGGCKAPQKTSSLPVGALVSALHSFETWIELLGRWKLQWFQVVSSRPLSEIGRFILWRTNPNGPGLKSANTICRLPSARGYLLHGCGDAVPAWPSCAEWLKPHDPSEAKGSAARPCFFHTGAERCGPSTLGW